MLAVAAIVLGLGVLIGSSLGEVAYHPGADEGYYLDYATKVSEGGWRVFPDLFRAWLGDPKGWIFPPPSRVGFVAVCALWARLFGASFRTLSCLSLASHLLLVLVVYGFARRHLGELRAVLLAALTGFSPVLMGLSRMALSDSFTLLWAAASVWLFLDAVHDPGRTGRRVAFMIAFGLAILAKELSILLAIPFAAFALIERLLRGSPLGLVRFGVALALPPALVLLVLVLAAGGAGNLLETVRIVLASPATNEYALHNGSGPWYRYVIDELLLSPWPTLLALGYGGVLVLRMRTGPYEPLPACLGLLSALLLLVFSFFTKNVRYLIVLELPIRVFAVSLLAELLGGLRTRRAAIACVLLVAALCWMDYQGYDLLFVRSHLYDPVSLALLKLRRLIAPR